MSSSTNSTITPTTNQILPAPFQINSTDKTGLVIVITTFFLISIIIFLLIRVYIRATLVNGAWRWDDYSVALATAISIARDGLAYKSVGQGCGQALDLLSPSALSVLEKNFLASTILYIISLFLSKSAVMLLLQRLCFEGKYARVLWSVFTLGLIWAVMSILLVTADCGEEILGRCGNMKARWIPICALDILTELSLFLSSVLLVAGIRMSWHLRLIVIAAFATRLPAIALTLLHTLSLLSPQDPTTYVITRSLQSSHLDFTIIACTFPLLGAVLKPFSRELGPSRSDDSQAGAYSLNNLSRGGDCLFQGGGTSHLARGWGVDTSVGVGRDSKSQSREIQREVEREVVLLENGKVVLKDTISICSADSQKGIIKEERKWDVDVEDGFSASTSSNEMSVDDRIVHAR